MSKRATAKATIPVRVGWKCSACGTDNDCPHTLTVEGTSEAIFAKDETLKARAREDLSRSMKKTEEAFRNGRFETAKLNALACKSCGAKELWAQYAEIPGWTFIVLAVGFIAAFLCFIFRNNGIVELCLVGVGALPPIVASIVTKIRNGRLNREIAAMPEQSKPHIVYLKRQ